MKTKLPFLLASLALVLPAHGKQDPIASAIQAASQTAQERPYGLIVSQSASTSTMADSCYLLITLPAAGATSMGGRGGSFGSGTSQLTPSQEEMAATLKQQRAAIAEALRPLGLELDQKTRVPQMGPVVNFGGYASLTLPIATSGEVRFGKCSPQQVQKALRGVSADSHFIFDISPKRSIATTKVLTEQAIKDGIDKAKRLASLAGASKLHLVRLQEGYANPGMAVTAFWPLDGALRAPVQTLSATVTLSFAPLDVVVPVKK